MVKHKNMALTSFYKNTKNTSTHGKIFTKCLLNTGLGLIQPKLQERSPHNRVGPNNNNKSNLDETCNLRGSSEKIKVPSPWERPLLAGISTRTDKALQWSKGKCSSQLAAAK